jgi:hypothetical protein
MRTLIPILYLYWRRKSIVVLSCVLLLGIVGSVAADRDIRLWWLAEDFWILLFTMSLWLAFAIGMAIKEQFAGMQAAILPDFRRPHLLAAGLVVALFALALVAWAVWGNPFGVKDFLKPFISLAVFAYLLIIIVGYISHQMLVFATYLFFLFAASQAGVVMDLLRGHALAREFFWFLSLAVGIAFGWRLWNLRPGCFEYPLRFTPEKKDFAFRGQRLGKSFFKGSHAPERPLEAYYPKSFIARAFHWEWPAQENRGVVPILLFIVTPLYIAYLEFFSAQEGFLYRPYSNFLLFAAAPTLMVVMHNYRKVFYWAQELLKPVSRTAFLKERGLVLCFQLLVRWLVLIFYFSVLPLLIARQGLVFDKKFWAYVLLTGVFSFLTFAWTVYMAAIKDERWVLAHGILLCVWVEVEILAVELVSARGMVIHLVVALVCAAMLTQRAFCLWKEKEF